MIFNKKHSLRIFLVLAVVAITLVIVFLSYHKYQYRDNDPQRGAELLPQTAFNDGFDKIYPSPEFSDWETAQTWQGWTPEQSMWYYNITQGSDLLPYDFFMVLQQTDSTQLFRAAQHIDQFRYIAQRQTDSNPDGLPLGFVKDTYKGKEYLGFTCSACHSSQIVYDRVAIRVDGAPAMSDMIAFMVALQKAVEHTLATPAKLSDFSQKVIARGNFDSAPDVKEALSDTATNLMLYNTMNRSKTDYGYSRLDAFGRIFNRILQHTLNREQLYKLLKQQMNDDVADKIIAGFESNIISGKDFDNLYKRLQPLLTVRQQLKLRNSIFNSPDAPVSYPFLWDTPQHDYVQWNGIAANASVGPVGRNVGEVLGVFGTLDWKEVEGNSLLANTVGGQKKDGRHISFESSVDVTNLRLIESQLKELHSPVWPETVLPKIDRKLAKKGEDIFKNYCASCHLPIDRTDPHRRVIAQFDKLDSILTDPRTAENSVSYQGYSGILQGNYVDIGVGSLYIQEKMPVAALLTSAATNVVLTPDPDKWFLRRWFDWIYNLANTATKNDVKESLKQGNVGLATAIAPYGDITAYKGRPLNGIWATAPYLHNGSVPTLYDLFLPQKRENDPEGGEYRPDEFWLGSRQFDAEKVGYINKPGQGTRFLTHLKANSNAGHEFAAGKTPQRNGKIWPALNKSQRMELVEYLKTL
ncbi:MAG: ribonuclease E [Algicola sp.]|nr:ribonuclease E [Algicola sp.]